MLSPKRVIFSTVVVLAALAISTSGAAAMSLDRAGATAHHGTAGWVTDPSTGKAVYADVAPGSYVRQDKQLVAPAVPASAPGIPAVRAPRFAAPTSGYSLADGFITTGAALLLLGLAGGVAVTRTRNRRGPALGH